MAVIQTYQDGRYAWRCEDCDRLRLEWPEMAGSPSPRYPRVNLIDAVADALRMRRAPDTEVQAFKAAASECESPEALWKLLSGWKDVGIGGSGNRRES